MQQDEAKEHLFIWPETPRLRHAVEENRYEICYTMPGVKTEELLPHDPEGNTQEFFDQYFSVVNPDVNNKGLTILLENSSTKNALNATTIILSKLGQGMGQRGQPSKNTEFSFQLWALRFQLLSVLNLKTQLLDEIAAFEELDAPDLFFQYYPNLNRKGSMIPFSLRLIHAEVLRFTPFPWRAIDRCENLARNVDKVIASLENTKSPEMFVVEWRKRLQAVKKMEARIVFQLGEYEQAMQKYVHLKTISPSNEKNEILLSMVRMALMMGDEYSANKYMEEMKREESHDMLHHKALLSTFLGAFPIAINYSNRALAVKQSSRAINTLANANLYSGKILEAIESFTKCPFPLPEPLSINLKTMVELAKGSSTTA